MRSARSAASLSPRKSPSVTDACEFCGTPYVRAKDPDDNPWRSLCRCEAHAQKCFKGHHYATHARLLGERTVFACDKHGVSLEDRAEAAPLPPEIPREREAKPRAPKPEKHKDEPAPPPRELTPEDYASVYAGEVWLVVCRCGSTHPRGARPWRKGEWIATNPTSGFGKGFHAIHSHCPACDAPDRDAETGDPTWRRETPESEAAPPPPAPKRTKKR